jgi:hypothetical protein
MHFAIFFGGSCLKTEVFKQLYMEEYMATLEIKDIPNDIYKELLDTAKMENLTLEQEALVLLKHGLSNINRQSKKLQYILQEVNKLSLGDTSSFPSPESLLREDRDR